MCHWSLSSSFLMLRLGLGATLPMDIDKGEGRGWLHKVANLSVLHHLLGTLVHDLQHECQTDKVTQQRRNSDDISHILTCHCLVTCQTPHSHLLFVTGAHGHH